MDELPEELQVQFLATLMMFMHIYIMLLNLQTALLSLKVLLEITGVYLLIRKKKRKRLCQYDRRVIRDVSLRRIIYESDLACIENTRMDRKAFHNLCDLLQTVGKLSSTKNMCVEELVAMFSHICAHHVKNRIIKRQFVRSGETISRQFKKVLNSIILCHNILLKKAEPVLENSTDYRWKWFKNCLGALDGTYIRCTVDNIEKPRYRTRKGEIAMNVLGVCNQNMEFIYILPGWEGSAADGRVLRDAITRPRGLKVPKGFYYLCDAGYTNGEGFLTPYRGQRYHLNDWRENQQPRTPQEFYNYKHSSARNVIERCFGFLKKRWAILRETSFYPVQTQARIVSACALIHNHIRREMPVDPLENEVPEVAPPEDNVVEEDFIDHIATSDGWSQFRDNLSISMWNESRN